MEKTNQGNTMEDNDLETEFTSQRWIEIFQQRTKNEDSYKTPSYGQS